MDIKDEKVSIDLGQLMVKVIRVEAYLEVLMNVNAEILSNQIGKDFNQIIIEVNDQISATALDIFQSLKKKE